MGTNNVEILLLGVAQDGGMAQIRCQCKNCSAVHNGRLSQQYAVSLAIIDRTTNQVWLIDCSPDFRAQYDLLQNHFGFNNTFKIEGIFLTHLHMGHYVGLYQFGRETLDTKGLKIYGTESVCQFFRNNQPWSTYIEIGNFQLNPILPQDEIQLSANLFIKSQIVPHRAEFSNTVAYFIRGPSRHIFYCPDVDSWERGWSNDNGLLPIDIVQNVDQAFLDATFFSADELPNRNIDEIPHPTVLQTLEKFKGLEHKITLIHLNHSNPLYDKQSKQREQCNQVGINIGIQGRVYEI
ncbi:unnamed protein product [Rotaria socialis]|uniref:Metallo-beta-lactamase domain-containing protein n=1 Tax=Rotaria socialis TaxID=392032 RepID=A0A818EM50_9BILA|nr:unnamed protein product [Rotaria socialis]CAF4463574.1 unnamed protein product [Rotaria socialis]